MKSRQCGISVLVRQMLSCGGGGGVGGPVKCQPFSPAVFVSPVLFV